MIAIKGAGANQSFTVRHIGIGNIGVERIFPVISPWIKKVTVKKRGDSRRAKLYYLRIKTAKETVRLGAEVAQEAAKISSPANDQPAAPHPSQG